MQNNTKYCSQIHTYKMTMGIINTNSRQRLSQGDRGDWRREEKQTWERAIEATTYVYNGLFLKII